MEKTITVPVRLDEKTFRRFALFDMFSLRRKWVRPLVFSAILVAFAVVALLARKEQSGMIAAVLLAVGIGLPLVYFGTFLSQVNMQAVRAKLKPARLVYTLTFTDAGIHIENNQKKEDPQDLDWASVHKAFRKRGCIYLYATPQKAFLIPRGQADVPDPEVWNFLTEHLGAEKCR